MKNSRYENFYVDLSHPRALLRDFDDHEYEGIEDIIICPIILFHQLKNSYSKITFNNEPSLDNLSILKEVYGINSILSCINHKNYLENLDYMVEINSILNFKINLNLQKLNDFKKGNIKQIFIDNMLNVYEKLMNENLTLLIHSASGDMKTGIVLYSLLRLNGESKEDSIELIRFLKKQKKKTIGDFNIEFFEKNIIPDLLNQYTSKYQ